MPKLNDLNFYSSLFNQIDNQTIVVTINKRLKEHLTELHLEYIRKQKQFVLLREIFVSLDDFIHCLYSNAQMINPKLEKLISDDEARFLLLSYLKKDKYVFMPNVRQAELMFSAWNLMQYWCVSLDDVQKEEHNVNVTFFLKCIFLYQIELNERGLIDKSQLVVKLLKKLEVLQEVFLNLRWRKVILIGFESFTPLIDQLFQYCRLNLKMSVITWRLSDHRSKVTITEYLEDKLEIQKIAKAVFILSQNDSSASIGVIVPDLQLQFGTLVSAFDQHFVSEKDKQSTFLDNHSRQYTISGGESLLNQPIVYHLMMWLKFDKVSSFTEIKIILCSSYVRGHRQYKNQRLQQIIELKRKVPESIDFLELTKLNFFKNSCDPVLKSIISELTELKQNRQKFSAIAFSQELKLITQILGYLGDYELSSLEHQALMQFYVLINKLIRLTRLNIKLTFNDWLIELQQLSDNELFQTQITTRSRIHILGIHEARDVSFDYLFVIRMNNVNWPRLSNMNPYLPISLQKVRGMPHSSVKHDLDYAQRTTNYLTKQATAIFFSYSVFNDKELQMVSPLLAPLASITTDHTIIEQGIIKKPINLMIFDDNSLPAMTVKEYNQIKGGAQIFKDIAECPYRAVLIHRLQISADKIHKPLLSATEKGVMIHHILEKIWRKLNSSENLLRTSRKTLSIIIEQEVKLALNHYCFLIGVIPKLIYNVEIKRLQDVILKWFNYEKLRKEPFVVLALEKIFEFTIAGVTLKLRLDRIDQLASNHTVVIDYKTSKRSQISNLLKTPIIESQLPLYAIYGDADAIAVAIVNGSNIGLQSISSIDGWISCDKPKTYPAKKILDIAPQNYTALKKRWKDELKHQMLLYLHGESTVTPSVKSCQYCEYQIVCRMAYS